MFRTSLIAAASLLVFTAAAAAQRATITSIDSEQHSIVVKVGEADYKADANQIELLDSDGKQAKLSDFVAKEKVMVTMTNQKVSAIQKLKDQLVADQGWAAQEPQSGKVVSVAGEKDQIVVKVGTTEHTATASKVKLLDNDGKVAKLGDFAAGDSVKVTLAEGVVTVIQLTK